MLLKVQRLFSMDYKLKPWLFQQKILDTVDAYDLDFYGLLLEMGTGKTKVALEILRQKCLRLGRVPKTLIIGPSAVQQNWAREVELHTYIDPALVQVIDGCTKPNGKVLKNPTKKLKLEQVQNPDKEIFITTIATPKNTVKMKKSDRLTEVWGLIEQLGIEFLIIDESHNFKSPTGTRTKALHRLSDQPQLKYKFILTGSPVLQDALDLWSQMYILNPEILGRNFYDFRSQYFYDENAGMPSHVHFPSWVPKDEDYFNKLREIGVDEKEIDKMKLSNLNDTIYRHACRVMKNDVLDLPPRTYQTLKVGMNKAHRKMYDEFRDNLVTILEEKPGKLKKELERLLENDLDLAENIPDIMSADLAIVKTLRLMQLACGIFTNDDGDITIVPCDKLKELASNIETITANKDNKIIIWTIFTPTYKQISEVCDEYKVGHVFLNGLQNKEEKQAAIDAFQNDPEVRIMIANPSAGGTGVNLTAANYEIDYSFGFKLGDWLQKDARANRGGQTRNTHSISLVTEETIEEKCLARLQEKAKHAEDILARKDFKRDEILGMI